MGLTTAMYTGMTGLNVNQTRIETIGHNIANVNTTAFKGSRTMFQTQLARTLTMGTRPSATSGGTNPTQIGLGAAVGSTQRTTGQGSVETTGLPADLALEGAGYFIVRAPNGRPYYTRDGAFGLNAENQLTTSGGLRVQGYGVDGNFTLIPGTLTDLTIPLGQNIIARATERVALDGALSAGETVATAGNLTVSQALVDGGGNQAAATTALTDVRALDRPAVPLFVNGTRITVNGAAKGERELSPRTFTVGTDGTTLGDFAAWLQDTLGIQTGPDLAGEPGVIVQNGTLLIRSNTGQPNAIQISGNDITSDNGVVPLPFSFIETAAAQGTGVFTAFTVYDSLGAPVTVNATFTLEQAAGTGPVWRYYLENAAPGSARRALGNGTVAFNTNGQFVSATGNQFALDRTGTGAASPLNFTLDLERLTGLATQSSNVVLGEQDGYPPGVLAAYSIARDGMITGTFSNGLTRTLGQVALAVFRNDQGLVAEAENLFSVGPNSGPAQVTTAGVLGAGSIRAGALELSNVDLTREFIGLITSSTAFQAASRVISTSSEMLDQLMLALR